MIPIIKYKAGDRQTLTKILERGAQDTANAQQIVDGILQSVKLEGIAAVLRYTEQFDHVNISAQNLRVTEDEIEQAALSIGEPLTDVLKTAYERIALFHRRQKQNSWFNIGEDGEITGQILNAVESCGIYAPGGKAAYPSTIFMNAIPAQIAGVERIVMVTPPNPDGTIRPIILAAARVAGVTEIYKAGGAQAIAALAFGTEIIPKVCKIVGPGNIFVALAKKSVFGEAGIDSVAGPSEILVLADESAEPRYIAADMLAQAEHDEMASAVLITDSAELANHVAKEIETQRVLLERKSIIEKSIRQYGLILVTEDLEQAAYLANQIAPEHLELIVRDPLMWLSKIKNAGAIFIGKHSPEPLGDYMAGPNHVLPTGGTARFFSPLSVDDFVKKTSLISFSQKALLNLSDQIIRFAEAEGLTAHAAAVRLRQTIGDAL